MKLSLPIVVAAFVFSFDGRSVAQAQPRALHVSRCVWVFDNADPDFRQPPFDDALTTLDDNGRIVKRTTGFNTAQTIGGHRAVVISPDGLFALVAENADKRFSKYTFPGTIEWSIPRSVNSASVSRNGNVYALSSDGTIYGDKLLLLNADDGRILKSLTVGGFDIVVDDHEKKIWVVGEDIQRLSRDELQVDFKLDPIQWCAVSVDYTSEGSAWIAERQHSQAGGLNRLLKVSSEGVIDKRVDFQDAPFCVAVNRANDTLWVAARNGLHLLDSEGTLLRKINTGPCWTVRVRQSDQSVWAAAKNGAIFQLDDSGNEVRRIVGFSGDQKYVAVP